MLENIDTSLIDWSRAQFALTAIYHWIFVPLTLGLAVVMGIMETVYYRTGDEFWKRTAKFWMKIYGIDSGIRVWNELEQLFLVCRRYFRSPTCHRGHSCFLYGGDIYSCNVLRLGES